MYWIAEYLWLIPGIPLFAAAVLALTPRPHHRFGAVIAIGALALSLLFSIVAFGATLGSSFPHGGQLVQNWTWFEFGATKLQLGWILDPLSASMMLMVSFVGLLIFIYSAGYMASDENATRFFCFLSLFAAAMLGLVAANSLLLLFMCWELVGLASYLLIGFWFQKPSAAAAAKKAFITTRIGDIGFFLGLLWLYSEAGTLLFYDAGSGALESAALGRMAGTTALLGMAASTVIGLLIFCGAIGKSGQVPLHVWLPDAMEGPTPVSALIHAATMVAAGVFLMARVYPLLDADAANIAASSTALSVVAWVGAITAVFAASIAVAQWDIKRILAYSTVSQLGYMMLGIGVGGVAVGMFHLITHAFFKALLFLGAGSVIHGCGGEQDIRRMGGVRSFMPVTFVTYAIGMMALAGVPLFFSGFWSKDEILASAYHWPVSWLPFVLAWIGAVLTAFYMTRQMVYVFAGEYRGQTATEAKQSHEAPAAHAATPFAHHTVQQPHESPRIMTAPLVVLAFFAIVLGFFGTPLWPWFHAYFTGHESHFDLGGLFNWKVLWVMCLSIAAVVIGIGAGWWIYGLLPSRRADEPDPLAELRVFGVWNRKYQVDELYAATVLKWTGLIGEFADRLDRRVWNGAIQLLTFAVIGLSWINRFIDEYVINLLFDRGCRRIGRGGEWSSRLQDGKVQHYLRAIGVALTVLLLVLIWGFER